MSYDAQVKLGNIEAGIKACGIASSVLGERAEDLRRKLQWAGDEWHDEKYRELTEIVESCIKSLGQPIDGLEASKRTLERLADAVRRYEGTRV